MRLFSAAQEFNTPTGIQIVGKRLVSIDVNGGTVVVAAQHDVGTWVDNETVSADDVVEIDFDGPPVRLTPTGSATFSLRINL